jgi:Fe-S cluster assembly iron-binding protein IscA
MVVSDLAKTKIKELLQQNDAKFLNIALAGNTIEGINTIITMHNNPPHSFIRITTNPEIMVDPLSYPILSSATLDFNQDTGELLLVL